MFARGSTMVRQCCIIRVSSSSFMEFVVRSVGPCSNPKNSSWNVVVFEFSNFPHFCCWFQSPCRMLLSGVTALSAFFVANSIPFFQDLVGLTGALTSVPLTLLLPAVFHRKLLRIPIWKCIDTKHFPSFGLLVFSILFMVTAFTGSVRSIMLDWENDKGGFFSCSR